MAEEQAPEKHAKKPCPKGRTLYQRKKSMKQFRWT